MKTGIVDVGGGLRGVYAAGVLDRCLEKNINFDVCIGVSAGSANVAAFAAGQKKRNLAFYTQYSMRKEYMSVRNYMKTGSYLNLDYIYGNLSNLEGENPLDYDNLIASRCDVIVVATNALTGKVHYFSKNDFFKNDYTVLKASCAIPAVCKPVFINNTPYYDGALSDCVPIKMAFDRGCDKVVLVLSKPKNAVAVSDNEIVFSKLIAKKYPCAARALRKHAINYNMGVELAKKYEKSGKVLIVSPAEIFGVNTLTRNATALNKLYEDGYRDAEIIESFLESSNQGYVRV